ncbi:MAG: hypothetical protein IJT77_12360 [Clostridia bacterium]|nr:hypothetical protein [Clostridia bacterium]
MKHKVMVSRHRNAHGDAIPDCIYYNGSKFIIKAVLDTVLSQGIVIYTVLIRNCITHLYADPNSSTWYVKEKTVQEKSA